MLHQPEVPIFHQENHNSLSKMKATDDLNLKKTLYMIEYEKCLRLRELDIERRQFLHRRRDSENNSNHTNDPQHYDQRREDLKKRIQIEKDAECRCQSSLQQRKAEFMDKINSTITAQKLRNSKKNLFDLDRESVEEISIRTQVPSLQDNTFNTNSNSNRMAELYRRGFDLLKQKKESNRNPFIATVDTILQKLRAQKEDPDQNGGPLDVLTKSVLNRYAADDEDAEVEGLVGKDEVAEIGRSQLSDQAKNKEDAKSVDKNKKGNNVDEGNDEIGHRNGGGSRKEKDDNKKILPRFSSKALNLWATVRKEQMSVMSLTERQNSAKDSSSQHSADTVQKISHDKKIPPNFSRNNSSTPKNLATEEKLANAKEISKNSDRDNNTVGLSLNVPIGTSVTKTKRAKSKVKIPTLNIETSSDQGENGERSPVIDSIAECNESSTPNTIIVVHEDGEAATPPPLHWDKGYRYSFSHKDNEIIDDESFFESSEKSDDKNDVTPPEFDDATRGQDKMNSLDPDRISNEFIESPTTPQDELSNNAIGFDNVAEIASNGRPSISRQGGRYSGRRRISMQTRGSLRALAGVMKEESRREEQIQDENLHPESSAYRAVFEALAGAASDAAEQSQRLNHVRRAGLGLASQDINVKDNKQLIKIKDMNGQKTPHMRRRNTIEAPGRFSSADVSDPVYKFLQRRTQSKTTRRHKTLSSVELKLLAHAPGEDITGRRHSFSPRQSSRQSSRRSSSSIISGESLRRLSISSSPRKVSSDLSMVLESDSGQSRRNSVRIGSASTRPNSVAMSMSDIDSMENGGLRVPKETRSYSWAPDVSETKEWHLLAMELLAHSNKGVLGFRTVSHMLQWLGEEYRRQTSAMLYEELRYCTYLRLPKHQQPMELVDSEIERVFSPEQTKWA